MKLVLEGVSRESLECAKAFQGVAYYNTNGSASLTTPLKLARRQRTCGGVYGGRGFPRNGVVMSSICFVFMDTYLLNKYLEPRTAYI